jgi:hypothetical protein
MARWIATVTGLLAIAIAGSIVFVALIGTGDTSAACDRDALVVAMRDAIAKADRAGVDQIAADRPEDCSAGDMMEAMLEVSRSWHVMPDGTMMRAPRHTPEPMR